MRELKLFFRLQSYWVFNLGIISQINLIQLFRWFTKSISKSPFLDFAFPFFLKINYFLLHFLLHILLSFLLLLFLDPSQLMLVSLVSAIIGSTLTKFNLIFIIVRYFSFIRFTSVFLSISRHFFTFIGFTLLNFFGLPRNFDSFFF